MDDEVGGDAYADVDPRAVRWRVGGEDEVYTWLAADTFVGRTGPCIQNLGGKKPLQLFLLFLPLAFWNHAVIQTNLYASAQRTGVLGFLINAKSCCDGSVTLAMACHTPNDMQSYGRTGLMGAITFPNFARFMSFKRYQAKTLLSLE
eukprot:jgi/Chlat1/613/Chrsp103S01033